MCVCESESESEKEEGVREGGREGGSEFNSRTISDEANLQLQYEDMFN